MSTVPPAIRPPASPLMPLPPWPLLVMASEPPFITKATSALIPDEEDRSVRSESSTPPETVSFTSPPSMRTVPSEVMAFLPSLLTVTSSLPPPITTASLPQMPWPLAALTVRVGAPSTRT